MLDIALIVLAVLGVVWAVGFFVGLKVFADAWTNFALSLQEGKPNPLAIRVTVLVIAAMWPLNLAAWAFVGRRRSRKVKGDSESMWR